MTGRVPKVIGSLESSREWALLGPNLRRAGPPAGGPQRFAEKLPSALSGARGMVALECMAAGPQTANTGWGERSVEERPRTGKRNFTPVAPP